MKNTSRFLSIAALSFSILVPSAFASLNVPSDGSDGALNVTSNTVIDLSLAASAPWTNSATGGGIYDSNQWAVVFKYSSVNIASNATVTFLNHPTHAPVIWLVQSNVTINGSVSLNGQDGTRAVPQEYTPAEPGPGGFRGGALGPSGAGGGYGPGAGNNQNGNYAGVYGNPQILPLIGGSGGSGAGLAGSGGGGAILIVAAGTVTINGQLTADGGTSQNSVWGGSAGAIRIVADQILGAGTIDASQPYQGRTRMEANTMSPQLNIFPNASAVLPGATPIIFPPANAPTVRVLTVDTQNVPLNPQGAVAGSSDVGIQNNSPVNITLQSQDLPIQSVVTLHVIPKYGYSTVLNASYVSGDINQAIWQVTTTLPQGFCVLQARATAP